MIKIEKTTVTNIENALRGARNPMNSWDKSDSEYGLGTMDEYKEAVKRVAATYDWPAEDMLLKNGIIKKWKKDLVEWALMGKNDWGLAIRLRKAGSDHRKYIRQIGVCCDITAPLYWWKEYDTYKVATVANSTSTMHKIHSKAIEMGDFSCDHLTPDAYKIMEGYVSEIEKIRLRYLENDKPKEDWYDLIAMLPESYNQTRTVTLNYETLINIYFARQGHKLDEWHDFCAWIESLPYSQLITYKEKETE